jgi:thiamine-phosphate pyrophosphorylase
VIPLARRLLLTVLVDPAAANGMSVLEQAARAIRGGATAIQLRSKAASVRELTAVGKALRNLCRDFDVLFIVNDRLDVALACGSDGVHLGQEDLPVDSAREIAPRGFVIGASAHDPEEARGAEKRGADYLGVGAVFPTMTKKNARFIGIEGLRAVVGSTTLPCVGIGGITALKAPEVLRCGACGVAVHSAVAQAGETGSAVREFRICMELERGEPHRA